jgi:hypothetical protein
MEMLTGGTFSFVRTVDIGRNIGASELDDTHLNYFGVSVLVVDCKG